ncbi:N-acetylglucosamine-6-phosphate deacetylase [Oceanobacillus jeddahense]|uniref:N-acetylglucosamine-6-phosphate deacetylase n=1 Tax=Oceanobacillus jeddahense TaxID=1462527 RepID=UPI000595FC2C|nr:amidohydrolase family protein [Oceanobacillus jeddahense]
MGNSEVAIEGIHYETKKPSRIIMKEGYIKEIKEINELVNEGYIITPGLIDLQVNGFKGIDFNQKPLDKEEWKKVIQHLSQVGVTTFYPTIITNSTKKLASIFEENVKQLFTGFKHTDVVGGFHLEGPYISMEDGPKGAHFEEFVKRPDWDEFCYFQEKARGMIKIVTLSPEWENSLYFIKKATNNDVKVAIGHTAASSNQIRSAVKEGAILSTHLGNGAHLLLPRHPNYIWDQLAEDHLWSSVISDGNHLPANVLKVINQVKNEKMILISDSVALAGMKQGDYKQAVGGEVTLTESGRLHLKGKPDLLAGSAQCLLQGVQNLEKNNITSFEEAIKKASIYPAKLMGLPQHRGLKEGAPADILLLKKNQTDYEVMETYKSGECLYRKGSE